MLAFKALNNVLISYLTMLPAVSAFLCTILFNTIGGNWWPQFCENLLSRNPRLNASGVQFSAKNTFFVARHAKTMPVIKGWSPLWINLTSIKSASRAAYCSLERGLFRRFTYTHKIRISRKRKHSGLDRADFQYIGLWLSIFFATDIQPISYGIPNRFLSLTKNLQCSENTPKFMSIWLKLNRILT